MSCEIWQISKLADSEVLSLHSTILIEHLVLTSHRSLHAVMRDLKKFFLVSIVINYGLKLSWLSFHSLRKTVFIMHSGHQIKLLIVKQSFLASLTQPLAVRLIDVPPCRYQAQRQAFYLGPYDLCV